MSSPTPSPLPAHRRVSIASHLTAEIPPHLALMKKDDAYRLVRLNGDLMIANAELVKSQRIMEGQIEELTRRAPIAVTVSASASQLESQTGQIASLTEKLASRDHSIARYEAAWGELALEKVRLEKELAIQIEAYRAGTVRENLLAAENRNLKAQLEAEKNLVVELRASMARQTAR